MLNVHTAFPTESSRVTNRTLHISIFVVALLLHARAVAQPDINAAVKQMGNNVKVTSVTSRYDFSKLPREIELPFTRFPYKQGDQPAGYTPSEKVKPATAVVGKLVKNWNNVLPSFGTPAEMIVQKYAGKDGGTIVFARWNAPLPDDARKQLCKLLYKADEKQPGTDTKDDLLVANTWCIIWSFSNPLSELKQAHQKHTFSVVNEEARRWMDANPDKAKKYLQPKN
jgi:hypothetical protein